MINFPRHVIYNVVADVDSYSLFLPWCVSSRVTSRKTGPDDSETLQTHIGVGFRLKQSSFSSTVTLTPLKQVHAVCAATEHLEELSFTWDFAPIGERACRLDLKLGAPFCPGLQRSAHSTRLTGCLLPPCRVLPPVGRARHDVGLCARQHHRGIPTSLSETVRSGGTARGCQELSALRMPSIYTCTVSVMMDSCAFNHAWVTYLGGSCPEVVEIGVGVVNSALAVAVIKTSQGSCVWMRRVLILVFSCAGAAVCREVECESIWDSGSSMYVAISTLPALISSTW